MNYDKGFLETKICPRCGQGNVSLDPTTPSNDIFDLYKCSARDCRVVVFKGRPELYKIHNEAGNTNNLSLSFSANKLKEIKGK